MTQAVPRKSAGALGCGTLFQSTLPSGPHGSSPVDPPHEETPRAARAHHHRHQPDQPKPPHRQAVEVGCGTRSHISKTRTQSWIGCRGNQRPRMR